MSEGRKALFILTLFFLVAGGYYFWQTNNLDNKIKKIGEETRSEEEWVNTLNKKLTQLSKTQITKEQIKELAELVPSGRGESQILQQIHAIANKYQVLITAINESESMEKAINNNRTTNQANDIIKQTNTTNQTNQTNPTNQTNIINQTNQNNTTNQNNPNGTDVKNYLKEDNWQIVISGDYLNLRGFVNELILAKRVYNITNWQITKVVEKNQEPNVAINQKGNEQLMLNFSTYYAPELTSKLPLLKPIEVNPANNNLLFK